MQVVPCHVTSSAKLSHYVWKHTKDINNIDHCYDCHIHVLCHIPSACCSRPFPLFVYLISFPW